MGFCTRRSFFLSVCILQMVRLWQTVWNILIHFLILANCDSKTSFRLSWFSLDTHFGKLFWNNIYYFWILWGLSISNQLYNCCKIYSKTSVPLCILIILFLVYSLACLMAELEYIYYLFIFKCWIGSWGKTC